jgi:DNA-binding beta-propeller fold protein YncE
MRLRLWIASFACLLVAALALGAAPATAFRASVSHGTPEGREEWLTDGELAKLPPATEGQIEGACGVAYSPLSGNLSVADYYHREVHQFSSSGTYVGSLSLAGGLPFTQINELNAVCGLAIDASGRRYANEFHQRVLLLPGEEVIDPGEATGVAVDAAGNLYVDDRTYVAVYDAPVTPGDLPARKIGTGSLVNAFGVAVDSAGDRVYVADAADQTVKMFEPKVDLTSPVTTIDGPSGEGFNSLFNAALTVDWSKTAGEGHLLVVDDLEPLTARPRAAIYEFTATGNFLDRLTTRKVGPPGEVKAIGPIFGEPSGIAVAPSSGNLYVTTGNSERANLLAYGPYQPLAPAALSEVAEEGSENAGSGGGPVSARAGVPPARSATGSAASESTVVQRRGVRVSFDGKLTPKALPRHGVAPVGIVVDARISATEGAEPPQLRRIAIAINRNGRFSSRGLPVCRLQRIQPSTTAGALAACRPSLVGEGRFTASVKLPQQSPFPSEGKVLAFNGRVHGKPAILAHIYGTQPIPTSIVLPFLIGSSHGTYGTTLSASLPQATGSWGYVTGLRMSLRRRFHYRGRSHSYLSAGCPAPAGFSSASFPLARTSFAFAQDLNMVAVLNRDCRARG